jgi:hypothetical protein
MLEAATSMTWFFRPCRTPHTDNQQTAGPLTSTLSVVQARTTTAPRQTSEGTDP